MKGLISKAICFVVAILLSICSCKEDAVKPVQISGTWIESKDRTDTLVFGYDNLLELKRGKELKNTSLLPKSGSGLYLYTLKQDSIALNYLLSSMQVLKSYAFKMEADKLSIGDFYQKNAGQSQLLIFERKK